MSLRWVAMIALIATLFMLLFMSYTANGQPITVPTTYGYPSVAP